MIYFILFILVLVLAVLHAKTTGSNENHKSSIFGKPYHIDFIFDSEEILQNKTKTIKGRNNGLELTFEAPTFIEFYSKKNKINSIWNYGNIFDKNKLLLMLELLTGFKITDINFLYNKFSDADFMKRFITVKKQHPLDIRTHYRFMADDVFNFLQKVFYWDKTENFPENPVYLDIGCENGWLTSGISELIKSNEYYGLELEENYTDYIGDSKKPSKDFVRVIKPLDKFPFPDNYFDFITCINKISTFKEREHILGEISRVLKPGGYFMIREYNVTTCILLMFVELERMFNNFKNDIKKITYGRYLSGRALSALIAEFPEFKFIIATGRNETDRKGNRRFNACRFADFLYKNEK